MNDEERSEPMGEPIAEPPPRVTRTTTRRPGARRQQRAGERPSRARKRPSPAQPEPSQATEAIRGLLQLPAAGFILVGQRVQSVPLVADGATILVHGGPFAEALAKIAENDPRMMALLEKLLAFGPYGEALALAIPFAAQFIRNHNEPAAPILEGFGAVPPEEIITAASLQIPTDVSPDGQVNRGSDETTAA